MFTRIGIILLGLAAAHAFAQSSSNPTTINLQTQSKNPNFSSFPITLPITVGTTLPSTCQVGQLFFNSSASAGANIYACTATNVWTVETASSASSSSSGATMAGQLGDFATTLNGNGTLTVGASCSSTTPCNVRLGNTVYRYTSAATITSSGSGTAIVFIYVDGGGNLTAGSSAALTCSGCTYVPNITGFLAGTIPLANWTLVNGSFSSGGGTDFRALISSKDLLSGPGISISENAGTSTVSVDSTVVPLYIPAPTSSSASCSAGQQAYDPNYFYLCVAANTWKRIALNSF